MAGPLVARDERSRRAQHKGLVEFDDAPLAVVAAAEGHPAVLEEHWQPSVRSVCLPASVCRSICLSVYLRVCVSVCLSTCLPLFLILSVYVSIDLSIYPSICLPVYLRLPVYLHDCLSESIYPWYVSIYLSLATGSGP